MSYEYSSQNLRLNFPNPLRLHNGFLAGAASIILLVGFWLLFSTRQALSLGLRGPALLSAIAAILMLAVSATYFYQCLTQLRFYFGRGRPAGLAPQLGPDQEGTSQEAQHTLKETLRQQAIEYREPSGPIAGLLYTIVPNLIYAPLPLRIYAERQFKGAVEICALLMGLLVASVFGASRTGSQGTSAPYWISLVFFIAAVPSLLLTNGPEPAQTNRLRLLSVEWLIALACFAVIGPVALSLIGGFLPPPPFHLALVSLTLFLVLALVMHALFFAAVLNQLTPAPPTAVSMIQETWNLSNSPSLITAEFLRATQEAWAEKIPNRRYIRIEPKIDLNAQSGAFHAEIIEETQPFPLLINRERKDQISPSGAPRFILFMDVFALVMIAAATLATLIATERLVGGSGLNGTAVLAIFFWILGSAGFASAQRLWLRFDFQSHLLWLELQGPYISARVEQGNVIGGTLRSSSSLVQVEGMTYRLWAAHVHTAAFGKDAIRHFVSVFGAPDLTEAMTARLKSFITAQGSLPALGNSTNAERIARNSTMVEGARFGATTIPPNGQVATVATKGDPSKP